MATLLHAMSSTSPDASARMTSSCRDSRVASCCSGMTAAPTFSSVPAVLPGKPCHDRVDFGLRPIDGHARLQTADNLQEVRIPCRQVVPA